MQFAGETANPFGRSKKCPTLWVTSFFVFNDLRAKRSATVSHFFLLAISSKLLPNNEPRCGAPAVPALFCGCRGRTVCVCAVRCCHPLPTMFALPLTISSRPEFSGWISQAELSPQAEDLEAPFFRGLGSPIREPAWRGLRLHADCMMRRLAESLREGRDGVASNLSESRRCGNSTTCRERICASVPRPAPIVSVGAEAPTS